MRFMMMVKANKDSEAGVLPSEGTLAAMAKYNEALVKAGVLIDGNGLQSSAKGARVTFAPGRPPKVIDGPFAEAKELIAGYWIIDVRSKAEAIEWAKRVPYEPGGHMDGEGEILLRQMFDIEDFGDSKAVDRHKKLGAKLAKKAKAVKKKTVYAGSRKAAKAKKPAAKAKKAAKPKR
jgi:hypothetical protein